MNKEDKNNKQTVYQQLAMILNYKPHIEHQHIHIDGKDNNEEENTEFEEVKAGQQEEPDSDEGGNEKKLNYKSPTIALQRMLEGDWFDKRSTDKKLYHKEWRSKLVADLMASEYGVHIATLWEYESKRPTIKGRLIGALAGAGVLKTNKAAIARAYLGYSDHTRDEDEKREVNTFGKYIGEWKKEPYANWVKDYVDKTSQKTK
jgi:hypothetical protein